MIVRLDKQNQRTARYQLLNDVVYIISHEAMRKMQHEGQTELSPVEVFLSARDFCETILELPDIEEGLDDEMDDLEYEAEGKNDFMLIMTQAMAILQAQNKKRVGIDIRKIIIRIFERLDGHELLLPLLEKMTDKEDARWMEGKKTALLDYELQEIKLEGEFIDGLEVVRAVVDAALGLSCEGIQHVENVLSEVNDKHAHQYDEDVNRLREARKKKSMLNIKIDKVNDIHDNPNVNIGNK